MSTSNELPPKTDISKQSGERVYRTALDVAYYLRLENEAMSRALRPYSLVKILITAYLDGRLIYLRELPESIQQQIKDYQALVTKTDV